MYILEKSDFTRFLPVVNTVSAETRLIAVSRSVTGTESHRDLCRDRNFIFPFLGFHGILDGRPSTLSGGEVDGYVFYMVAG